MDSNKRIKVISLYKYVNKPDIMTADNLETDVCCFLVAILLKQLIAGVRCLQAENFCRHNTQHLKRRK